MGLIRARGVALVVAAVLAATFQVLSPSAAAANAPTVSVSQSGAGVVTLSGRTATAHPKIRIERRATSGWAFVKRVRAHHHRYSTTVSVAPGATVTFRLTSDRASRTVRVTAAPTREQTAGGTGVPTSPTSGQTDGSTAGTTSGTTDGSTAGTTSGTTDGSTSGSTDGSTSGSTDGSTSGTTDGTATNPEQAPGTTAPSRTLYASPSGSGTTCTSSRPCSLSAAQTQARAAAAADLDVTVLLAGGTYQLDSPLSFTSVDSGTAGHRVTYRAVSGQVPVISGGRTVTGWKLYSAAKNIWVASVPGISATRQLYVNGRRASLASAPAATVFGTLTPTSAGYQTSQSAALAPWSGAADAPDLVYPGAPFPWAASLCPVTATTPTTVTMANPCFQNLRTPMPGYTVDDATLSRPAYVENNLALLTRPGQFYVSTRDGQVFYMPRTGETMTSATVVAPQLSSLLSANGVANLTISGLTFAYATWLPSATQGVVDIQSNVITGSSNTEWAMIPSAVTFAGSRGVVFTSNTVTRLGGAGVSLEAGGGSNALRANVVSDVSATGISIASPLAAPESGDEVTNNYVHHVATEYQGGVGIFAGIVSHTVIAHNEVAAVPSVGISLGWGWGSSVGMTDNHIDYNRVHEVNQSSLFDGGAIYLNGPEEGSTGNSSVSGNYVSGDPQPYGALYLDSGASNYNVSSNVVAHTGTSWIYLQTSQYGSPAVGNTVSGNFTDTPRSTQCSTTSSACPASMTIDSSNSFSNNSTGLTTWPSAASSVMAASGIESAYSSIKGSASDVDLSYRATATASATDGASPASGAANDGVSATAWTSAPGAANAYWQTDLGSARTLTGVQVLTDQSTDRPASRGNLKLVVSNSPITSGGSTVVCTVGVDEVAYKGTIDCVPPSGTWRYVGVVATAGQQLSLAEVRVSGR